MSSSGATSERSSTMSTSSTTTSVMRDDQSACRERCAVAQVGLDRGRPRRRARRRRPPPSRRRGRPGSGRRPRSSTGRARATRRAARPAAPLLDGPDVGDAVDPRDGLRHRLRPRRVGHDDVGRRVRAAGERLGRAAPGPATDSTSPRKELLCVRPSQRFSRPSVQDAAAGRSCATQTRRGRAWTRSPSAPPRAVRLVHALVAEVRDARPERPAAEDDQQRRQQRQHREHRAGDAQRADRARDRPCR